MPLAEENKKVGFITLGCKVNSYETEAIWQLFKNEGYRRVSADETADVFVINTCTVTNTGDKKSRQTIRKIIRKNPEAIICVTGCYAQIDSEAVAGILGVDIVIGTQNRANLIELIEDFKRMRKPINAVTNIMKTKVFEELEVTEFTNRTRAALKIQEGCNQFCTFCIIPWARGLIRSRAPKNVIEQAQKLAEAGYKEIVLTGIHTGGYGQDLENYTLTMLLSDLEKQVPEIKRIRISSIEESQINDDLLRFLEISSKVVRHFHVPLQSGSNTVLARMNRKYTREQFAESISKLRKVFPDAAITSDVIVGFPGETESEFQETLDFVSNVKFAELHVFPYSKRAKTPAATYPLQVSEPIKADRVQRLILLSTKLSEAYASNYTQKILEVIPEARHSDDKHGNLYEGYSDNYLRVIFPGTDAQVGELVRVRVVKAGYPFCTGVQV